MELGSDQINLRCQVTLNVLMPWVLSSEGEEVLFGKVIYKWWTSFPCSLLTLALITIQLCTLMCWDVSVLSNTCATSVWPLELHMKFTSFFEAMHFQKEGVSVSMLTTICYAMLSTVCTLLSCVHKIHIHGNVNWSTSLAALNFMLCDVNLWVWIAHAANEYHRHLPVASGLSVVRGYSGHLQPGLSHPPRSSMLHTEERGVTGDKAI